MAEITTDFHTFLQGLDALKRAELERNCQIVEVGAGTIMYAQNSEADAVYLIEQGVVEVLQISPDGQRERSIAHLRRGDIVGELGVLTQRTRVATVRAAEPCVLYRIEKSAFLKLIQRIPPLGTFLAIRMADRLYKSAANNYFQIHSVDFSGNLHNLDVLLVFQMINSSARDGELRMINSTNDTYGRFFFEGGHVRYAKFAHVEGLEAVWQLFLETELEGNFIFVMMDKPTASFDEAFRIELDGTDVLMQAASKRDIYQSFADSSKNLDRRLSRLADELIWEDDRTRVLVNTIWSQIGKRPKTLNTIWRLSNVSWITLIELTRQLRDLGLVSLEAAPE